MRRAVERMDWLGGREWKMVGGDSYEAKGGSQPAQRGGA